MYELTSPELAFVVFSFQAEDGIRDTSVTGVQTCALPIWLPHLPHPGTRAVSLTWQTARTGAYPRILLTSLDISGELHQAAATGQKIAVIQREAFAEPFDGFVILIGQQPHAAWVPGMKRFVHQSRELGGKRVLARQVEPEGVGERGAVFVSPIVVKRF